MNKVDEFVTAFDHWRESWEGTGGSLFSAVIDARAALAEERDDTMTTTELKYLPALWRERAAKERSGHQVKENYRATALDFCATELEAALQAKAEGWDAAAGGMNQMGPGTLAYAAALRDCAADIAPEKVTP